MRRPPVGWAALRQPHHLHRENRAADGGCQCAGCAGKSQREDEAQVAVGSAIEIFASPDARHEVARSGG